MRRLLLLLVLAAACGACGKTRVAPPPEVTWYLHVESACNAAKASKKPLLFYLAASWDVASMELDTRIFSDPEVRMILDRDWIALKVDRSNVYMNSHPPPDEEREVEAAQRRFKPYASKYASVVLMQPDCETEIGRVDAVFDPRMVSERLRSAQKAAR